MNKVNGKNILIFDLETTGLPEKLIKSYEEVWEAPKGWKWHQELNLQFSNGKKAIAHHGYSSNVLLASKKRSTSLIQFHFHTNFSIQYWVLRAQPQSTIAVSPRPNSNVSR